MEVDRLHAPLELSQNRRLLVLETALPSATLVVHSAQWVENVSGHGMETAHLYRSYFVDAEEVQGLWSSGDLDGHAPPLCPFLGVIDAVSGSGHLALKALLGEQVTLSLMLEDGSYRTFHAYVVMAANLGSDNGRSLVRLGVSSFTHFMTLRRDSRVFIQQSASQIIGSVLSAYPQANWRLAVRNADDVLGVVTQLKETDAGFLTRFLSELGWNWHLEHRNDGPPLGEARAAKHCLVITDERHPTVNVGAVRFSRPDIRQTTGLVEDTLTQLGLASEVAVNEVTVGSWDYSSLTGVSGHGKATDTLPALEVYTGGGEREYATHVRGEARDAPNAARAEHRAWLQLAQLRQHASLLFGKGAVRRLGVFNLFEVREHSRLKGEEGRYQILSLEHQAANNLPFDVAGLKRRPQAPQGSYQQHFGAVPVGVEVVPPVPPAQYAKPKAELDVAIVVGWDEAAFGPITTNRDLQIRVQFPWQRGKSPVSGGLPGPATPQRQDSGYAPGTGAASMWVRLAQPIAGPNWGATFMPRIGSEVLVEYVNGDIDKPLIVGQLHGPQARPPWPVEDGVNHAGVISGVHSQSHESATDGVNQWLMDDSNGQLRMRLASGTLGGWSELSLGHIIMQGRQGTDSQRGGWLGSGYYGHTDGWAIVRSHEGLLLSTSARPGTYGSAHGTQMDAREAVEQVRAAQALGTRLNRALKSQGAAELVSHGDDAAQALFGLVQDIDSTKNGRYAGSVGGQEAQMARTNGRELERPVARFDAPHIVMQTATAGVQASPGPISSYSSMDTSLSSQSDFQMSSAYTIAVATGETTSVYTHDGPLRLITSNNALSVEAQADQLEVLADGLIVTQSVDGEIQIQAQTRVELRCGESKVVLDGGKIDFHSNEITIHASLHDMS